MVGLRGICDQIISPCVLQLAPGRGVAGNFELGENVFVVLRVSIRSKATLFLVSRNEGICKIWRTLDSFHFGYKAEGVY